MTLPPLWKFPENASVLVALPVPKRSLGRRSRKLVGTFVKFDGIVSLPSSRTSQSWKLMTTKTHVFAFTYQLPSSNLGVSKPHQI